MTHFDSDYMAGAHPEIIRRITETNLEETPGYGFDNYTEQAKHAVLNACGLNPNDSDVFFLVGGTQTNATVIDGLLRTHQGVITIGTGHINVHEAGAIEAFGHKVITITGCDGKLMAKDLKKYLSDFFNDETWVHMVEPGMVYISYPTELGTLYSLNELKEIKAVCKEYGLPLYIDGARLGYGLAANGGDLTLNDLATVADAFYIGGTKVGALFGEAVVIPDKTNLPRFKTIIKQHGALLAKGRLLGLQFLTLFSNNLYYSISEHAIKMAMKLKEGFTQRGCKLYIDSPTNQQFFILENGIMDKIRKFTSFEVWGNRGEKETAVRFVTCWATKESDIDELFANIDKLQA